MKPGIQLGDRHMVCVCVCEQQMLESSERSDLVGNGEMIV